MTNSNSFMTVEQQGSTLGQNAVAPSFLERLFHQTQRKLKNRKAGGEVKGGEAVRPLFQPELADITPKRDLQRLHDYQKKLLSMEAA